MIVIQRCLAQLKQGKLVQTDGMDSDSDEEVDSTTGPTAEDHQLSDSKRKSEDDDPNPDRAKRHKEGSETEAASSVESSDSTDSQVLDTSVKPGEDGKLENQEVKTPAQVDGGAKNTETAEDVGMVDGAVELQPPTVDDGGSEVRDGVDQRARCGSPKPMDEVIEDPSHMVVEAEACVAVEGERSGQGNDVDIVQEPCTQTVGEGEVQKQDNMGVCGDQPHNNDSSQPLSHENLNHESASLAGPDQVVMPVETEQVANENRRDDMSDMSEFGRDGNTHEPSVLEHAAVRSESDVPENVDDHKDVGFETGKQVSCASDGNEHEHTDANCPLSHG